MCTVMFWPAVMAAFALTLGTPVGDRVMTEQEQDVTVPLPAPCEQGAMSVEAALSARASVREFRCTPLSLAEVSQVLWAAQGVTHGSGRRTAPSAGALYPLELYLVAGQVEGLEAGLYRYRIGTHELARVAGVDLRGELVEAALHQDWMADAPAVLVIAGVVERTAGKYGGRATRYVHMEVGAVAENVYLQATALGLGTTFVGAFSDTRVKDVLRLPGSEQAFALLPLGRPR